MQHSAASHLGLYYLLRPVLPNTYGKYGSSFGYTVSTLFSEKITEHSAIMSRGFVKEEYFVIILGYFFSVLYKNVDTY